MNGKVCMVTGSNSGIGKATALGLAEKGATVVMVCRNAESGKAAIDEIRTKSGNSDITLMLTDLASQESIRQLARNFVNKYQNLHVLVNNAGVLLGSRSVTADGIETTFAVNHLAYFMLTSLLLDRLKASAPARIVNVSSSAHGRGHIDFNDLQGEKRYTSFGAYSQSKLANVLFTYALAKRLQGSGVTANCLHPGVVATGLWRSAGALGAIMKISSPFMLSPEKGARTCVYLSSSPDVDGISGKYFGKETVVRSSSESYDESVQERLWKISAELTGLV